MITGSDDPELEAAAVAAGLTCFIRKPFSPAKIIFELKQVEHARKLLKKSKALKGSPIVGLRAIIAEDSAILRKLLTVILNSIGVEVVGEASNGQEVLDLADQHDVEVILMDLKMPVMGGLEALVKIKETHPTIRVIIVSGNTEAQMVRDAISLGASGYLVKPFDRDKVIEVMSNLMF
jgi:two-component system chemotaxis response regulator CheY